MSEITIKPAIRAMKQADIAKVKALETQMREMPQSPVATDHILHGGQYSRTVLIPAGMLITGALIKIPTLLTICGDCTVFIGDDSRRITGYNVLTASAGRKQAFIAHDDTYLTMTFATKASTIEEAENEFTNEADLLLSRTDVGENTILITGE